jgi:hypothetical protein
MFKEQIMEFSSSRGIILCSVVGGMALLVMGCGRSDSTSGAKPEKSIQAAKTKGHGSEGWWCAEHGMPEAECSQCNAPVAAEFKAKGDWCEEHDRAKSQCFKCDPKLKEKYAALYRAKEGKDPPPTEGEKPDKKEEAPKKDTKP